MTEEEARKIENALRTSNHRLVRFLVGAGAVLLSVAATCALFNAVGQGLTETRELSPVRSELPQKDHLTGKLTYTLPPEIAKHTP